MPVCVLCLVLGLFPALLFSEGALDVQLLVGWSPSHYDAFHIIACF